MYQHGNHPPVTVYTYYKTWNESEWIPFGEQSTESNGQFMFEYICCLQPDTAYDLKLEAVNTRVASNVTTYTMKGQTLG